MRVTGVVRDEANAIALPGVPVEVVGTNEVVYTDVDGRYVLQVPPGKHQIKVAAGGLPGKADQCRGRPSGRTSDGGHRLDDEAAHRDGDRDRRRRSTLETSSAEAQLIERKQAPVITDNIGSQEMKDNGDRDAAAAMERVTGVSVVDNSVRLRARPR